MLTKMKLLAAAGAMAIALPNAADAAPYIFTLTGSYNATFQLDSNPIPDVAFNGTGFYLFDRAFSRASTGIADIDFSNSTSSGGLVIFDDRAVRYILSASGPQLYTGTEAAPMFRTGTFALTDDFGTGSYTLNIASAIGAVPEPATWAMMLAGFGMIGFAARKRSAVKTTVSFA